MNQVNGPGSGEKPVGALPRALERSDEIAGRIGDGRIAVFLDYDGTLAPIVDDPRDAIMAGAMRQALGRLARVCPTAIVSGRDLADVRALVGVDGIHYAGSHGFEIVEPDGKRHVRGEEFRPALERSAEALEARLEGVEGAWVERKGFAVAIHFRRLRNPEDESHVARAVSDVLAGEPDLKRTHGKKIFELRPAIDWDKGAAILSILHLMKPVGQTVMPIYLGDDVTDEDGFRAMKGRGIGFVVEDEETRESVADYALADLDDVRRFLELLTGIASRRSARTEAREDGSTSSMRAGSRRT